MNILSGLAKHGISAVVSFFLGLVAIAVICPVTTNGKMILLVLTVIRICVTLGALGALVARWVGSRGPSDEQAEGPAVAIRRGRRHAGVSQA